MSFINYVLEPPSYGWQNENGELIKPSPRQILSEFFTRLNIFKSKKNWLVFTGWFCVLCLMPFLVLFIFKYFTWGLLIIGFFYSMIVMGTHGTIWHHRYCTHGSYRFRNRLWRFITQNLVIRLVPEEIYAISHHVHHAISDQPGDPYNAKGGWLYCFLADANHQPISRNLSERDYGRVVSLLKHTGMSCNSYTQYQKWGSAAKPLNTAIFIFLNWAFWFSVFFVIGGADLTCTLFSGALIWVIGVRTFNYEGHGKGKDKRHKGTDFNNSDMSVNQYWPGIVAGEWHNNHHLFPGSARAGFLKHQIDFAWYYIYFLYLIGGITSYRNSRKEFYNKYFYPYKQTDRAEDNQD